MEGLVIFVVMGFGLVMLLTIVVLLAHLYILHRAMFPKWEKEEYRPQDPIALYSPRVAAPVEPPAPEIILHPAIQDYINAESEGWLRDDLKMKAKRLYAEQPNWEWVLTELRKLNEAGTLPEM